jgi:nitroreductase
MSILKEILERRSVRQYLDKDVTKEQVMEILEAGRLSLSGSNTQPWRFMVIRDKAKKEKIVAVDHEQEWMMQAPVFIACLADMKSREDEHPIPENTLEDSPDNVVKLVIRDTAIAVSFMVLQAQHMGLNTCWTGWYDQREMRTALGISDDYYVSAILTVGYGAESPEQRPRHSMEEILLLDESEA